jgi:hypothetical protein
MVGHYTISIELQSFVPLAILQAIDKDVPIDISCKDIKPPDNSKGDKVKFILITDFVFMTHRKMLLMIIKVTSRIPRASLQPCA